MSLPTLPPNTSYDRIMRGYFGDRTTDDKNTLWQAFLRQEGLTSNPTETPELLARYSTYIDSLYEAQQKLAESAGDPRLQMLWSIYDILILLISKFVKCQINNQLAVEFMTRYQKEYQNEMSRAFFYVGAPAVSGTDRNQVLSSTPDGARTPTSVEAPSAMPIFNSGSSTSLIDGYVNYLYTQASENPAGTPYSITLGGKQIASKGDLNKYGDLQGHPYTTITVTRNADNTYAIQVSSYVEMYEKWWGWIDKRTLLNQTYTQSGTSGSDYESFKNTVHSVFQTSYNQANAALQTKERAMELYVPAFYDINTFKLGYGNLTVGEYFNWLYRKASENAAGTPYSLTIPAKQIASVGDLNWYSDMPGNPYITLSVTKSADNTYTITVSSHVEQFEKWWGWIDKTTLLNNTYTSSGTITITSNEEYESFMKKAQSVFLTSYSNAQAVVLNRDRSFNVYVPWENNILLNYTGPTDEIKSDYAKEIKFRSERNRNIQNCIDAIKSRKDVIGDKADQQQRLIDSSSSGRKQSSNILQTIVRQMQTILGSIFRG